MKDLANYPDILAKEFGFENEAEMIKSERERMRYEDWEINGMFVVCDIEGNPMFPTVSFDKETAIQRMVKLGPGKPWEYYMEKGHTVEKVTINIRKEKLPL